MLNIQKENQDLRRSQRELEDEVWQLKDQLAQKVGEFNLSIQRRQTRTVAHVDTLSQLNLAKAELKMSREKCADLEEKLHQSEEVEALKIEFSKREEELKLQFPKKEQQMQSWMEQKLNKMEEEFHHKLSEEREKPQLQMFEREERLRELERGSSKEREDGLKKQLSTFLELWQTEAAQWRQQQSELQQKLQEQERLRKQQEEERKQEAEDFQQNLQQLWNYIKKKEKKRRRRKGSGASF